MPRLLETLLAISGSESLSKLRYESHKVEPCWLRNWFLTKKRMMLQRGRISQLADIFFLPAFVHFHAHLWPILISKIGNITAINESKRKQCNGTIVVVSTCLEWKNIGFKNTINKAGYYRAYRDTRTIITTDFMPHGCFVTNAIAQNQHVLSYPINKRDITCPTIR